MLLRLPLPLLRLVNGASYTEPRLAGPVDPSEHCFVLDDKHSLLSAPLSPAVPFFLSPTPLLNDWAARDAAPLEAYDEEHRPQCVRLGSTDNLNANSE